MASTAERATIEYVPFPNEYLKEEFSGRGRQKLSMNALLLQGLISAFTEKSGGAFLTHDDVHEQLEMGKTTSVRCLMRLRDEGKIEADKSRRDYIRYVSKIELCKSSFFMYDKELLRTVTETFGELHLTRSEEIFICKVVDICIRKDKENKGQYKVGRYTAGYSGIQTQLNVVETTARRIVKKLLHYDVIRQQKVGTAINAPSEYSLNPKLTHKWIEILERREQEKSQALKAQSGYSAEDFREQKERKRAIKTIDERGSMESFFARRRQKAYDAVRDYKSIAESDSEYVDVQKELSLFSKHLAEAELKGDSARFERLKCEQKVLLAKRARVLARLNLTDAMLELQWECKKCSDTGYLPDGRLCDCYPPKGRGRP